MRTNCTVGCNYRFDASRDKLVIDRFLHGLEEHRIDLCGEEQWDGFCVVALTYLEALLDPGTDVLDTSRIELTASCATSVWDEMTDRQKTALWCEAGELHAIIAPLCGSENVVKKLQEWRRSNQPKI